MKLAEVVATSRKVKATRSRNAKRDALADLVRRADPAEVPLVVAYLSGQLPQGRVGLGYATLRAATGAPTDDSALEVSDVDAAMNRIAGDNGPGSVERRASALGSILGAATADEQRFLWGLFLGELRQGASESSMVDALASVAGTDSERVRRAVMLSGDLGTVAKAITEAGPDALDGFDLVLFRPIRPMLAATAEDVAAAVAKNAPASVEAKLDGARIQVHKQGDRIGVYTRNLRDVTDRVPEIVADVRRWSVDTAVVDGEAIALRADGRPEPFQVTMSRFGSETQEASPPAVPLVGYYFDCLYVDGRVLLDEPLSERLRALDEVVRASGRTERITTTDAAEADRFARAVLAHGHEGVMVKALDAPYRAGRRGAAWLKVKPAHTLDLVVIAVEWGSGRRKGWLSNLHLGARDDDGGFVMLGKTFKGLTDEMLAWQTERFLELETHREGHVVYVRPDQVVEIAFDGIQASSRYPGGMALRFARVKGYREDKSAAEADHIDAVRAILDGRNP